MDYKINSPNRCDLTCKISTNEHARIFTLPIAAENISLIIQNKITEALYLYQCPLNQLKDIFEVPKHQFIQQV